ncbi:MAG: hypothetical protein AMXMBFR64_22250 [Myxococcales bacterium]
MDIVDADSPDNEDIASSDAAEVISDVGSIDDSPVAPCGADECIGSCRGCPAGEACSPTGRCDPQCAPFCSDRACGSDGCGGECGKCGSGETCTPSGRCEPECTPSCNGETCRSDGCGGECQCPAGWACNANGVCALWCWPTCNDKECGYNGCGIECGLCDEGEVCTEAGMCEPEVP